MTTPTDNDALTYPTSQSNTAPGSGQRRYTNDLLLQAARREAVPRPPVWLMRQAGRILPEYRQVRAQAGSFINLVTNPALAAEVTIQPVNLLGVDAAIIFSDILVIPEAMGLPYRMEERKGPTFDEVITTRADVERMRVSDPEEHLGYVLEAIRMTVGELNGRVPLIGFAGAPWTILAYMVEGSGSKTFSRARAFLTHEPELAHELLDKITESTITYLRAQVRAGVALVQVFDSWAGILSPALYRTFSLPYLERIARALSDEVPVTLFAKGAWFALPELAKAGNQVVGIDWNTPPELARTWCGPDVALQGNLDPAALYGTPDTIRHEVLAMVESFGRQGYIANLGHGVYPDTNPDHVRVMINTIKSLEVS